MSFHRKCTQKVFSPEIIYSHYQIRVSYQNTQITCDIILPKKQGMISGKEIYDHLYETYPQLEGKKIFYFGKFINDIDLVSISKLVLHIPILK